jgi:hypothetical protein
VRSSTPQVWRPWIASQSPDLLLLPPQPVPGHGGAPPTPSPSSVEPSPAIRPPAIARRGANRLRLRGSRHVGDIPQADDPVARVRLGGNLDGPLPGLLDYVVKDRVGGPLVGGRQKPKKVRAKRRHCPRHRRPGGSRHRPVEVAAPAEWGSATGSRSAGLPTGAGPGQGSRSRFSGIEVISSNTHR